MKIKFLQVAQIKEIAEDFRDGNWEKRRFPVDIERIIEHELKLDLIPLTGLKKSISMDAYLKSDMTGIVVDRDEYFDDRFHNRLRFSLAHEVGHFVLHKEYWSHLHVDSLDDYRNHISTSDEKEWRGVEWQANCFAGLLLVPENELRIRMLDAIEELKRNGLIHLLKQAPDMVTTSALPFIGRSFGCSDDVIERRLKDEGLWPLTD